MEAGRELDALVAEKVMGLIPPEGFVPRNGQWEKDCEKWHYPESRSVTTWTEEWPPRYSTDIAAAWEVVEKVDLFGRRGYYMTRNEQGGWDVWEGSDWFIVESGTTAPHAICLAALKAVGVEA